MSFIRVTRRNGTKFDVNSQHIISHEPEGENGSLLELTTGNTESVVDSPRSLRGYIKKAQGLLPVAAEVVPAGE